MVTRVAEFFARVDFIEQRFCQLVNRSSEIAVIRGIFSIVSRLGDGVLWYALIAMLPVLYGLQGLWMAAHTLLTGLVCLLVYKYLKTSLVRERPYISFSAIRCAAPALDRYSFPSGHTMHAVCFSLLLAGYMPHGASIVWTFTALVGISRVVLGLHYPSDVAAGALLGLAIGWSAQYVFPFTLSAI